MRLTQRLLKMAREQEAQMKAFAAQARPIEPSETTKATHAEEYRPHDAKEILAHLRQMLHQ
jgi:hypothetical protein